jgi:hypothetical protein
MGKMVMVMDWFAGSSRGDVDGDRGQSGITVFIIKT